LKNLSRDILRNLSNGASVKYEVLKSEILSLTYAIKH